MGTSSPFTTSDTSSVQPSCPRLTRPAICFPCSYNLSPEELCTKISLCDALIVRSGTKVSRELFESFGGRLKVVGRAGVGIDNVDLAAATKHGWLVVNAPTANTVATAEHGIALLAAKLTPPLKPSISSSSLYAAQDAASGRGTSMLVYRLWGKHLRLWVLEKLALKLPGEPRDSVCMLLHTIHMPQPIVPVQLLWNL
ncbi:D-3-phosphoglycerate dehydrogenase-like [Morus notabilis]|uniref:D-3-phosphoglycerate dehydrogenase-like n=1 Tax=Morus notabilis TaxID=981085 RepID=UPI000CECF972|nr:D-3-phosphoglycerate dehydrogenase-like [Morus notabilis]